MVGAAVGGEGAARSRSRAICGISAGAVCWGTGGFAAASTGLGTVDGAVGGDAGWPSRMRASGMPSGTGAACGMLPPVGAVGGVGAVGVGAVGIVGGAVPGIGSGVPSRTRASCIGGGAGVAAGERGMAGAAPSDAGTVARTVGGAVGGVVGGAEAAAPRSRARSPGVPTRGGAASSGKVGAGVSVLPGPVGGAAAGPGTGVGSVTLVGGAVAGAGAAGPRSRASTTGFRALGGPSRSLNANRPDVGAAGILYRASRARRAASRSGATSGPGESGDGRIVSAASAGLAPVVGSGCSGLA